MKLTRKIKRRIQKNRFKSGARVLSGALSVCLMLSVLGISASAKVSDNVSEENKSDAVFQFVNEFDNFQADINNYRAMLDSELANMKSEFNSSLNDMSIEYDRQFQQKKVNIQDQFNAMDTELTQKMNKLGQDVNKDLNDMRNDQSLKDGEQDATIGALETRNKELKTQMKQLYEWADKMGPTIVGKYAERQPKRPTITTTPFETVLTWDMTNSAGTGYLDTRYVKGFKVYRSEDGFLNSSGTDITSKFSGTTSSVGSVGTYIPCGTSTSQTFTLNDTGLKAGQDYSYRIASVISTNGNSTVDSEQNPSTSNNITLMTSQSSTQTDPLTSLHPSAGTNIVDGENYIVKWELPEHHPYLSGYKVYLYSDPERTTLVSSQTVEGDTSEQAIFKGLDVQRAYYSTVRSIVASGFTYTGEITTGGYNASAMTPFVASYHPVSSEAVVTQSKMTVTWTRPDNYAYLSGYKVYVYADANRTELLQSKEVSGNETLSTTFKGFEAGKNYYTMVRGVLADGHTTKAGEINKGGTTAWVSTPDPELFLPENLQAVISGDAHLVLTWNVSATYSSWIDHYVVHVYDNPTYQGEEVDANGKVTPANNGELTTATITGLTPGQMYYIQLNPVLKDGALTSVEILDGPSVGEMAGYEVNEVNINYTDITRKEQKTERDGGSTSLYTISYYDVTGTLQTVTEPGVYEIAQFKPVTVVIKCDVNEPNWTTLTKHRWALGTWSDNVSSSHNIQKSDTDIEFPWFTNYKWNCTHAGTLNISGRCTGTNDISSAKEGLITHTYSEIGYKFNVTVPNE